MDNKPGGSMTFLSAGARLLLRVPITIIKTITTVAAIGESSGLSDSRFGIVGKAIGWPPPKLDPSRETAWLDGLRGIAALLVLAFHYQSMFVSLGFYTEAPYGSALEPKKTIVYDFWRLPILRVLVTSGHTQVSIFFVLSGFVLSWSSFAHIRSGQSDRILNSLSSAAVRRWFRLYVPCFIIGIISLVTTCLRIDHPIGVEIYPNIFRQIWDYILACEAFARPLIRDRKYPNWLHKYAWVMWTIPLEFEGSLLVFFLLLCVARAKSYLMRTLALGFLAFYACIFGYWTYWLFTSGMLVADYVREMGGFSSIVQSTSRSSRLFWWAALVLGLWMAGIPTPSPKLYNSYGYEFLSGLVPSSYADIEGGGRFWWSMSGLIILVSGCHLRTVQVVCESSIARYLGRISFMLYLTHSGLPASASSPFRTWFSTAYGTKVYDEIFKKDFDQFTLFPGMIMYFTSWLISGAIAIIMAHWCEVLVDRPSVVFAKWIEMKFTGGGGSLTVIRDSRLQEQGNESENAILLPVFRHPDNE